MQRSMEFVGKSSDKNSLPVNSVSDLSDDKQLPPRYLSTSTALWQCQQNKSLRSLKLRFMWLDDKKELLVQLLDY